MEKQYPWYLCEECNTEWSFAQDPDTGEFVCEPCWLSNQPKYNHCEVVLYRVNEYGPDTYVYKGMYLDLNGEEVKLRPDKEYWYFFTWTLKDGHVIKEVEQNIRKFCARRDTLGLLYVDTVFEHGSESEREHYHMRIKCKYPLKKTHIKNYVYAGNIHRKPIRPQTEENWNGDLASYMTKENIPERRI